MPFALVLAWTLFFGFVNTHQRHAAGFRGASATFRLALQASVLLGSLVGLGLLIYYFTQVAWYWPVVVFLAGSLAGGLVFGLLDAKLGQLPISLLAFVGWPAAAVWTYFIINALQP
jgi:hypothetical protein